METKQRFDFLLDYFEYSKKDEKINLPNEIFKDFNSPLLRTNRHKAFAYAYYFLACYLYRNVKYVKVNDSKKLYSMNLLLALNVNQPKLNYITKRLGVLDQLGYTTSDHDYPVNCIYDDSRLVRFEMASECNEELKELIRFPYTMVLKFPKKAFYRDRQLAEYTGTFFEYENTHIIDFSVFAKCISEKEDGFELFFLYGFLKAFEGYINPKVVYMEYLRVSLGFGNRKVKRLLCKLVSMGLIKLNHDKLLRYSILE